MLIQDDRYWSVAPTDPVITELDEVQMQLNEVARACKQPPKNIRSSGAAIFSTTNGGPPSPIFPALAAGIRGVLSYQLFTNRGGAGALNLFSRSVGAINTEGEAIGAMLATHVAGVMMAVSRRQVSQSALATRDVIGQAKGIMMNQFSWTPCVRSS